MSEEIVIRCQTPQGSYSISHLTLSSSYLELQDVVEQITGIPPAQQKLLKGYPPQDISGSDVLLPIWSLGFLSGDSIIVERINPPADLVAAMSGQANANPTKQTSTSTGRQAVHQGKKRVTSPETCSQPFATVDPQQKNVKRNFLFEGHSLAKAAELRKLAAEVIASDPITYDAVFLGRSNSDYVNWLRRDTSWGGSPELVVFSTLYQTEINVVDIQRVTLEEFGKDNNYSRRAFLLYDGIHYDPLYMETNGRVKTLFPRADEDIKIRALALASDFKDDRQYTDLHGFSLKCIVCGLPLKGQHQAHKHAKETGHMNFREI